MTVEELAREVRSLKQRVDLAETRLSQIEGKFEFVSGQLRDIQLYQHKKFAEIDARLDRLDGRMDGLDGRMDRIEGRMDRVETKLGELTMEVRALPRAIAEMIAKRHAASPTGRASPMAT